MSDLQQQRGIAHQRLLNRAAVIKDSKYSSFSVTKKHFTTDLMEAVLNCKQEELEDYYGLLGCDELSSVSGHWV